MLIVIKANIYLPLTVSRSCIKCFMSICLYLILKKRFYKVMKSPIYFTASMGTTGVVNMDLEGSLSLTFKQSTSFELVYFSKGNIYVGMTPSDGLYYTPWKFSPTSCIALHFCNTDMKQYKLSNGYSGIWIRALITWQRTERTVKFETKQINRQRGRLQSEEARFKSPHPF